MATLVFRVSAQYDEVIKLRNEISKLEAQLKKMDVNKSPAAAKALETQLASTRQQMMGLVTEAAKAGAVMEKDFKSKIYTASQSVNDFTQKIIDQKRVVKDVEYDVKRLGEAYKIALKRNPIGAAGLLSEYQSAKKALDEEKSVLFGLTQQQAEARLSVKRLKDEYSAFKEEAGEATEANEGMSLSLTKVLGIIGGVTALKGFVSELINVRGQFQQLEIAFSTMLKSKEKADKLMGELVDIAAKTPFDLQGIASSAKQMLAYGSSAENVGDELVMLGNVAAGVGSQLGDLAYLYGTLRTQGRAYAVDIRQFAGRGIPIYEELAKVLGVTKDKVSELVKEGKVGFKEVEQAFKNMTSESGIYYNLMEEQSKSLTGQLSNLGDAWDSMLNEIGKNTQGIASSGISALKGLIENYETVGKVLLGLIATYGTYKTATLALWVIEQARARTLLTGIASTKALTAAQAALNVVMKANPYVLVATTLAGVVSAMWAFHDSATESEKAQDRLNKKQEEAGKIAEEHKVKIDKLIDSSRDLSLSDLQRGQSLADLRKEYPKIFAQYDIESIKLADILKLKQQIAEEDARRAGEKKEQDFVNLESEIAQYENMLKSLSGQQGVDGYVEKLKELRAERDILLKERGKGISEQFISSLKEIDISEFDRYISELEKRIKGKGEDGKVKMRLPIDVKGSLSDEALFEVKDIKTLIDTAKSTRQSRIEAPQKQTTYQDDLAKAKLDWETAKKGYQSLIKDQNATTEQVKKAREEMEAKEKAYKELGGTTEIKSTDKDKQKQEQEKLYDQLLQLRFKNQQDEINLMKEGAEKKRKQIELDYQKEYAEIQKLEKEWGGKNDGKLTQEQSIEISRRYTTIKESRDNSLFLVERERQEAEKKAFNLYLKEYGTFQEKKAAIATEYSNKIIAAQTQGERLSLQKEYLNELKDIDLKELKSKLDFNKIFSDIEKQSSESLINLRDKLNEYVINAGDKYSPDDLKELHDSLKAIDAELLERNPFEGLKQRVEAMQQAAQELEKAKDILERVQNGEQVVDTYRTVTDAQGNTKIEKTYLTVEKALKNYNKAKEKSEETSRDFIKAEEEAKKQVDNLASAFNDIGNTIGGTTGEILTLMGDITSFATTSIDGITRVTQTGAQAISAVEKASVILGIISAAIQILQKISELATDTAFKQYESYAAKIKEINQMTDAVNQYAIAVSEARAEENSWFGESGLRDLRDYKNIQDNVLDAYYAKANESQAEYQNKKHGGWITTPFNATMAYGSMLSPFEGWRDIWGYGNYDQGTTSAINNLRIETRAKSNGFLGTGIGGKDQKTEDLTTWAREQGLGELFDDKGLINKDLAQSIIENYGDKLQGQTQETLEALIELREQYDEYIQQLHEYVNSLYEPLVDNFVDAMWSWFDEGKSALDSFKEYASDTFRNIVSDMLRTIILDKVVGTYAEDIAQLYEGYSERNAPRTRFQKKRYRAKYGKSYEEGDFEKQLMEGVADRTQDLIENYKENIPFLEEMMNSISDILGDAGIDIGLGASKGQQSASSKGFTSMSQDTGEELNGRFTALQESGIRIELENQKQTTAITELKGSISALTVLYAEAYNIADETRTILANSYLELQQIRENTGEIIKPIKQIQVDIAEVKQNTSRL